MTDSREVQPLSTPSAKRSISQPAKQDSRLILGSPSIRLQGVVLQEGDDTSARARLTTLYPIAPNALFGAEVDLTSGRGFSDSPDTGINLNELYFAWSPKNVPELRFIVGLSDLTSYFDRSSFAKDAATHFFNRAFQTNPALSAAGISSRPGLVVNWSAADNLELKAAAFSSSRNLGEFAIDGFAGELEYRFGTLILRGTYATSRDRGKNTGFEEIFQVPRSDTEFGFGSNDREEAYGLNLEWFIPALKMGVFGRYGRYNNLSLNQGGDTYSFGVNFLDLFLLDDRLGIGYGQQLSNADLRKAGDARKPDVLEVFYDIRVLPFLRAAIMVQQRNEFSETVVGFRVRTDFDLSPRR